MSEPAAAAVVEEALRRIGAGRGTRLDVAEAALLLAARERPDLDLAPYRAHLAEMVAGARERAHADVGRAIVGLNGLLFAELGYRGDTATYDDPRNANLADVIDRRRGLPVALGILYIHAGRAMGLDVHGLNTPGHFLVGIGTGDRRIVCDPFNTGRILDAAGLRQILVSAGEQTIEDIDLVRYPPMDDHVVLLRLQNNLKLRALRSGDSDRAVQVLESMVLVAPGHAASWRELAGLYAGRESLVAARQALERGLAVAGGSEMRAIEADLARLRRRFN